MTYFAAIFRPCPEISNSHRYSCQKAGLSCPEVLRRMRWAQLALCPILTLAAAAYGQGAKTASSKSAGTFSTTSRNVVLDVIVTDSSGRPVPGLTAHDFKLL